MRNGLARPEIDRFAEDHVLQQVSETTLVIAFVNGAGVDGDAQAHLAWRHPVLAHGVAQPVGQFAEQPLRIDGNIGAAIDPRIVRIRILRRIGLGRGDGAIAGKLRQRRSWNQKGERNEDACGAREKGHAVP